MDLEKKAIERIKLASEMSIQHYGKPLVCTYSGGKDSDVMLELFKRSGILFEVHNSHTTVDAPQTVYHIRDKFKKLEEQRIKCTIEKPTYKGKSVTMWSLIPQKKMPPWRRMRYCCSVLKETGCANRFISTGVRWDESKSREERQAYETNTAKKEDKVALPDEIMLMNDNDDKRKMMEHCQLKGKMIVNPIIDWTHRDIWEYIQQEHIYYNPLYDCGYKRVGCIGCPMAGKGRWSEFADFPTYERAYIRAFDKMLEALKADGKNPRWKTGYDVFLWWMEDGNMNGQYGMDFEGMDLIGYTEKGN
jgi:3'-phosphoadenosine 5'-phosphosulfate sulfotransferase (PAPS reductase)/FAD synthetase